MSEHYDVIVVGSGFAASFFLHRYLETARETERILVLERGRPDPWAWQIENLSSSSTNSEELFVNNHSHKRWNYTIGFGGSSNCWWACVPRMMPNDFQLFSTYGVGVDWPLSYADIEPYYEEVEEVMAVSGSDDGAPFPRRGPYPQPPHLFNETDKLFKAAYPDLFFPQPTARARVSVGARGRCCANGGCTLCGANAKFTIQNEMYRLYEDPRVTLRMEATAETVQTQGGVATGVTYSYNGASQTAQADLVVLAANGMYNPHILLRSGFDDPLLGKRLNEQVSVMSRIDLDGLDNFQGSTVITGHGYMLYDGPHRAEHAACLIESYNVPHHSWLRLEPGKWQQRLVLKFIFEDLPNEDSQIRLSSDPAKPEAVFAGISDYARRAIRNLQTELPNLLSTLPIEHISGFTPPSSTEGHIQGTTIMGTDPQQSVVDPHLKHHRVRNLLVLGSSVYPTCPPANPTLTLSALSLWAVDHL